MDFPRFALNVKGFFLCFFSIPGLIFAVPLWGDELPRTIERLKPSIVVIATYQKTRSPVVKFLGTGFAVGDGALVLTNAHVVPDGVEGSKLETLGVVVAKNETETEFRIASRVAQDKEHDLLLLKISGPPLPAVELGDSSASREGQVFAFTGFPIGMILGFHPVTHRATLSSITPIVLPVHNSKQLDAKNIIQLQKFAFPVFQLDGTAYPGNSGSPLYDPDTGVVYGIINMVLIKGMKESALSQPSGITYAIPSSYVREFLQRK
jgi:serine protease Do